MTEFPIIFLITKFIFVIASLGNSEKNKKDRNHSVTPTLLSNTVLPAPLTLGMQGHPFVLPRFHFCLTFSVPPAESLMESLVTGCPGVPFSTLLKALRAKDSLRVRVVWGRALMNLR